MSEKVVSLRAVSDDGEPVGEVVDLLRDLLARAEAGEIVAIVAALLHRDRDFSGCTAGDPSGYGMIGVLSNHIHILNKTESEEP